MLQDTISLRIPFISLLDSVSRLNLEEKQSLLDLLEIELAETEEQMLEQSEEAVSELREARVAYKTGDYVTLEEYVANRQD